MENIAFLKSSRPSLLIKRIALGINIPLIAKWKDKNGCFVDPAW